MIQTGHPTYHLPVVLHFSEDRLLGPQAPIPRPNHLGVVGHAAVLVFGRTVAHVQDSVRLLSVGGRKDETCRLNQRARITAAELPLVVGLIQMCLRGVAAYLCGRLWLCSGLPPRPPPGQRARVSPSQLALLWLLGGYELDQFDQQPPGQLPLPVQTQRLLPLERRSSQADMSQQPGVGRLKGRGLTEAFRPFSVCISQASCTRVLRARTSACLQEYLQVTSTTCGGDGEAPSGTPSLEGSSWLLSHLVPGESQNVGELLPPASLIQQRLIAGVLTGVAVQPAALGQRVHLCPHVV